VNRSVKLHTQAQKHLCNKHKINVMEVDSYSGPSVDLNYNREKHRGLQQFVFCLNGAGKILATL
jgi:hypothetical protein